MNVSPNTTDTHTYDHTHSNSLLKQCFNNVDCESMTNTLTGSVAYNYYIVFILNKFRIIKY